MVLGDQLPGAPPPQMDPSKNHFLKAKFNKNSETIKVTNFKF